MTVESLTTGRTRPIRVSISRAAAASIPEVTYVLRTLLRIAGYSWTLQWADDDPDCDIAYGDVPGARASVRIPQAPWPFSRAPEFEPTGVVPVGTAFLPRFAGEESRRIAAHPSELAFPVDLLFACYWWLTGAREPMYRRDRVDNLHIDEASVVRRDSLLSAPCVSLAAGLLRRHFEAFNVPSRSPPWAVRGKRYAFSFSHDVDYPEIIRWIEVPRVLASRGPAGFRQAIDVATGRSHFWTFDEWIDLAGSRGTRPAFYFMARQGSLLQYALGTPDDFYDVGSPRFRKLIGELRARGCEIGLHASYHSNRSVAVLAAERERIESVAAVTGIGNRHHYWHLDPNDPNETLRRHQEAGLAYDSSLGFEYYPGFRRGICHPFRPYHPGLRRELDIVQVPPAWMDDHFDRRLAQNRITDPAKAAGQLLGVAGQTGGVVVVNYHSRGMNRQFYPRYGPWLARFIQEHVESDAHFTTPREIVEDYRRHAHDLEQHSEDRLVEGNPALATPSRLTISPLGHEDVAATAALHVALFGDPATNGYSVAALGPELLASVFYRLNLDNATFHCDVAKVDGRLVAFSLYTTDRSRVFRHPVRQHPFRLMSATATAILKRPASLRVLLKNLMYLGGERVAFLDGVKGWWIVAGVDPAYRTPEAERLTGGPIAAQLFDRMESRFRAAGCRSWYGVVRPDNIAINRFLLRRGAKEVGLGQAQGLTMRYYVKEFA
jgi:hypothetical protein